MHVPKLVQSRLKSSTERCDGQVFPQCAFRGFLGLWFSQVAGCHFSMVMLVPISARETLKCCYATSSISLYRLRYFVSAQEEGQSAHLKSEWDTSGRRGEKKRYNTLINDPMLFACKVAYMSNGKQRKRGHEDKREEEMKGRENNHDKSVGCGSTGRSPDWVEIMPCFLDATVNKQRRDKMLPWMTWRFIRFLPFQAGC